MKVKTRNGGIENINFNKIKDKLDYLVELNDLKNVEPDLVAKETVAHIYDGISTTELDDHSANIAASYATVHPEYLKLAGSIIISSIHKETSDSCYESWMKLTKLTDKNGNNYSILNDTFLELIEKYKVEIDSIIVHNRDYKLFDYFGIKTLTRSYLLKDNNGIVERPQYMFLRVALTVNMGNDFDFKKVLNTYNLLSQGYYIHATPTLYNAGTVNQQLASCFLLKMKEDSIDGIFDTIKDCAQISKYAGGIGVSVHEIRGTGSIIRGTNGISNGLRPMLQVFNQTARYVDQGGGKRKGSIAIYVEPHHCDIYDFLDLKTNVGDENSKARDLFLALWIPDLFMERVEKKQLWSLMSPDECPNLNKVYGDEFRQLYEKYEAEGKYRRQVNAVDLFKRIMEVQIETGIPYICYKDAANIKSNQKNLGTIESSNLCVSGDTMILTSKGYFQIKDLVNKSVEVWNGTRFSSTVIKKTGEEQKLITVKFSNGMEIKCTPYHKFYLDNNVIVEASNLNVGNKIITYNLPIIRKTDVSLNFTYSSVSTIVPINYSFNIKLKWLEDYTNDKGTITNICGVYNIIFSSENKQFLTDVFYLLQTLGCNTLINKKDNLYKLYIDNNNLYHLKNLGFNPRNNLTCYQINSNKTIKVKSIEDTDIFDDTYCFNEPLEHKGIFNGIITGQCSEIMEYSSANEYANCNLCSINLTKFIKDELFDFDTLRKVAYVATENLDRVIDVNKYPCPETEVSNLKHRPIGLGVQGLADVFFLLKIPFDSMEARVLNDKIFETI